MIQQHNIIINLTFFVVIGELSSVHSVWYQPPQIQLLYYKVLFKDQERQIFTNKKRTAQVPWQGPLLKPLVKKSSMLVEAFQATILGHSKANKPTYRNNINKSQKYVMDLSTPRPQSPELPPQPFTQLGLLQNLMNPGFTTFIELVLRCDLQLILVLVRKARKTDYLKQKPPNQPHAH